ncbi:MAG: glycosyltransferase, partial [Bacteroidia bacterium]|nr:glycosyltransferase [Bacteroidia bacterium]
IHNSIKLLTISNLKDNHKNISFLLKVISEIIKIYPNITLDIYGEGSDKKMLLQIAKDLNLLNTHVFFKGKIDNNDISDVYIQYHAFILLSKFETFSIVTAEAILHGLPVIVSKCGGPEEYVIHGVNGYLVEINNLEQTIHAIQELISNYSNFKPELVKNTLIEKYSVEKVYKQFIELYDIEKSF